MGCLLFSLKNKRKNNGFTLLEVILAIMIIGVISISIPPLFIFVTHSTQYNKASFTATSLASEQMEFIRALSFNEIGTVGGNPTGNIEMIEIKDIDGRSYAIQTLINWVEEGGCSIGGSADWDYKSVRVIVTATDFFKGGVELSKEIQTSIARDSEQPAFVGSNLRICIFRGWNPAFDPHNPVYINAVKDVTVTITGPSIATVISNDKGSALFLGINQGNYSIDIDSNFLSMIVLPNTYPKNVNVSHGNTTQEFAFVEYPSSLQISLKYVDSNKPIILNETNFTEGILTLNHPYDNDWIKVFTSTDENGKLPSDLFLKLWPVGVGYAGLYRFDDITIPGYIVSAKGIWDADNNEEWKGAFEAPNTIKYLDIFLIQIPIPDESVIESSSKNWTRGNSTNITQNNPAYEGIAFYEKNEMKFLTGSNFFSEHHHDKLQLNSGNPQYTASELFFTNKMLEVSTQAELKLRANKIVFEGSILLNKHNDSNRDGKITFNIIAENLNSSEGIIVVEESIINGLMDGSEIEDINGNRGISGKKYGAVFFNEDVYLDNTLLISKGAYYFPDGFKLPFDYSKLPQEGGLIAR